MDVALLSREGVRGLKSDLPTQGAANLSKRDGTGTVAGAGSGAVVSCLCSAEARRDS